MSPATPSIGSTRAAEGRAPEPPLYRPFARLAFGTAAGAGVPVGVWMFARLYWTGSPLGPEWRLLHAHLQTFGFFGVLILGIARHLVPRFAGTPVTGDGARSVLVLMVLGLALRVAGTVAGRPVIAIPATLLEAVAFGLFAGWLWRALAAPALALTRRYLALASGWLVAALLLEATLRIRALATGEGLPDPDGMRAVASMALLGGVAGWMLGVLLRAGPMFVAGWQVPAWLARRGAGLLGAGVLVGAAGEFLERVAVAQLGEAAALATVAGAAIAGGALRRPPARSLLARGGPAAWLFRLALVSATVAAVGTATGAALAGLGTNIGLLPDAVRHLVTVGFETSLAVGMTFRLIPVFEGVPLPWPRLPAIAFAALVPSVVLRTSEVLANPGWTLVLRWLPVSGLLAWLAVAAVLLTLLAVGRPGRGSGARPAPSG